MKRLEHEWLTYERAVLIPAGAGAVQTQETRRGFYAGAAALYGILTGQVSGGHPDTVTQEDMQLMQDIANELKEHRELVRAGKR